MAVMCDWLHLLTDDNGQVHNPWTKGTRISVVEIGCGNGKLCRLLSDLRLIVTGVDITDGPYDRKGYKFQELDICRVPWPFDDDYTDYCLCFDVLEHIAQENINNILKEMGRISRNIILKVACSGEPPLHLCVKSVGWWLNQLVVNCPDFAWRLVRTFNMYPDNDVVTYAPLFYGRKVF